ncbi:PIN domain-containing protein [Aestuariimicrobium sp. p3-SID1156]|uniref:TA system VapC family ribonuclease toxin n=1 Tax=Aestuariimicrobium sp. p3-SID1156 TaxID=2916038 RepID=UPI00223BD26F|nr:TA system VapC family ribonuclease toxin [Aestuariimicrobium sp. p3-SID1156]MCT1458843.1 PIN domain-containing protein [Aestuariimicrobium sp. p3-SID1156]
MLIIDANVLLYAANASAPQHLASREWLLHQLREGTEVVGMPWTSLLAFLRIATNRQLFTEALSVDEATGLVRSWLDHPRVVTPEPSPRHLDVLAGLLSASGSAANLTSDAHLAALALEVNGTVVSFDRDFARFSVKTLVPQIPER